MCTPVKNISLECKPTRQNNDNYDTNDSAHAKSHAKKKPSLAGYTMEYLYIVGSTPTVCRLVHNNMILLAEDKEG